MAQLYRGPIPQRPVPRHYGDFRVSPPWLLRPGFPCFFIGRNSNRRVATKFARADAILSKKISAPILTKVFYNAIQNVGAKSGSPTNVTSQMNPQSDMHLYELYHMASPGLKRAGSLISTGCHLYGYTGKVRMGDFLVRLQVAPPHFFIFAIYFYYCFWGKGWCRLGGSFLLLRNFPR